MVSWEFPWRSEIGSERPGAALSRCNSKVFTRSLGDCGTHSPGFGDRCELTGCLLEEDFQVGCQIEDKVLRHSAPDKWAGEFAIEKVRCLYPVPK